MKQFQGPVNSLHKRLRVACHLLVSRVGDSTNLQHGRITVAQLIELPACFGGVTPENMHAEAATRTISFARCHSRLSHVIHFLRLTYCISSSMLLNALRTLNAFLISSTVIPG